MSESPDRSEASGSAPSEPSLRDALAVAAQRSALGRVTPGQAPTAGALLAAMGGVRGLVESILPGLGFLVTYTVTAQLVPSVLAPLAVAAAFIVARAVARQPVMTAVAGAVGVGISAALALLTGNVSNNFVPGFVVNAVVVLAMLISFVVRRPLVGVLVGTLLGDDHWRRDAAKLRVAAIATILWTALSAARLAVQVPLYLADAAGALAATKLIMGVPLYAGLLWVTWLLVRTAWRPRESPAEAS